MQAQNTKKYKEFHFQDASLSDPCVVTAQVWDGDSTCLGWGQYMSGLAIKGSNSMKNFSIFLTLDQ